MDFTLRVRTAQRSLVLYHDIIALPIKNAKKYEVFFAPCGGDFFNIKKISAYAEIK
jgi:hypothetical protein